MRLHVCAVVLFMIATSASAYADINLGTPTQLPTPEGGKYTMPTFSPDCRSIAFSRKDFGGLYVSDWQGNFSRIAEEPLSGWRYSWTPDGQGLVYRVRYGDSSALAGMVSSRDGNNQMQITDWQNDLFPPQCGKDGITFKAGDDIITVDEKGQVKSVKTISDGRGIVSRVAGVSLAFFANDMAGVTMAAFAALMPAASGKGNEKDVITSADNGLWVVDENGDHKELLNVEDESGYFSPQTSPVGDAVAAPGLSGHLYVADMAGGGPIDLGIGQNPTWSPDGHYLIYEVTTDDGHDITGSDLWIASRDGRWKKQLTSTGDRERYPSWSPDGRMIIYEIDGKIYYALVEQQ